MEQKVSYALMSRRKCEVLYGQKLLNCDLNVDSALNLDSDLKLDSALNELGMLSTITGNRVDYIKELKEKSYAKAAMVSKKKSSNSLSSVPLCIMQMNSDFVTKFSVSKNSSITDCELSDESLRTDSKFKEKRSSLRFRPYSKTAERRKKLDNRYSQIRRSKKMTEEYPEPIESSLSDCTEKTTGSLIVPHNDCGNKSNPSSPVKSQNSSMSVGCSIVRSRSLDDLEISKLTLTEDCCSEASHGEIDTVSTRISKLRVS